MKKKILVAVLSAAMLVGGAATVFGADAVDTTKLSEIKSLTQQMFGIQQQILEKEVEAGLLTQEQADMMKERNEQHLQRTEEALDKGEVPGLGMKNRGEMKQFNNGEPMTDEQIASWVENAQSRIKAQEEAMKSTGKLTEDQIKTWFDGAQAQLSIQVEAMKNGTFITGGSGMHVGKGMHAF